MRVTSAFTPLPQRIRRFVSITGLGLVLLSTSGCFFWAAAEYARRLDAAVKALPSVQLRVVNKTGVSARVWFSSGIKIGAVPFPYPGSEALVDYADSQEVVVSAGGTVTGTIKCGEVIGVAAATPGDLTSYYGPSELGYGLYMSAGNIRFSGAGSSPSGGSSFTGDVENTQLSRYVQPLVDGLNCSAGTIAVEVTTAGTPGTLDAQTGTYVGGTTGAGTLTIE